MAIRVPEQIQDVFFTKIYNCLNEINYQYDYYYHYYIIIIIRLTLLSDYWDKVMCLNFDREIRQIEQCAQRVLADFYFFFFGPFRR